MDNIIKIDWFGYNRYYYIDSKIRIKYNIFLRKYYLQRKGVIFWRTTFTTQNIDNYFYNMDRLCEYLFRMETKKYDCLF